MTDRTHPAESFVVVRDDAPGVAALKGAVAAIGNFDGVHRGHRVVIDAALARAKAIGAPAIAVTFEPHPRAVLRPDEPMFRLTDETSEAAAPRRDRAQRSAGAHLRQGVRQPDRRRNSLPASWSAGSA